MLSLTGPADIQGTIKLTKRPTRLGEVTDVEGNKWHIRAIYYDYMCAVRLDEVHPYYTDTSGRGYQLVQQTWMPYKWEI